MKQEENTQETAVRESRDLEALHLENEQWRSDLEFWDFELDFLHKLLNQRFLQVEPEDIDAMESLEEKIDDWKELTIEDVRSELEDHEHYLGQLAETSTYADEECYKEHKRLKKRMGEINKSLRKFKTEVFDFVEVYIP